MAVIQPSPLSVAISKTISADKFVNNRLLNRLGAQPARAVAASGLLAWRRRRWTDEMTEAERELLDQGVVLIPNYIDAGTFEALLEEVERGAAKFLKGSPEPDKFGIVRQQISVHRYPKDFPIAHRVLLQNENLLHAIRVSEGWSDKDDFSNKGTVLKYEKLEQVAEAVLVEESRDEENSSGDMHSNSFHVVTKAFLTLTPADPAEQPLPLLSGVAAPEPWTVALRIRDQRPFRSIRSGRVSKTRPCVRHPSDGVETGCCHGRQEHHAHHRYVRLSSARPHDRKGSRAKNAALGFPLEPVHAVTTAGPGERLCRLLGRRAITIADAGAAGGIAKRWRPLAPRSPDRRLRA